MKTVKNSKLKIQDSRSPSAYTLLTPGPTPVPQEFLNKMAEPVLHHRTPEFGRILNSVFENLRYVFQTETAEAFVLSGSGTAALETAIVNFFSAGERVLICSIGAFGERWSAMAKAHGLNADVLKFEQGQAVDPQKVKEYLGSHPDVRGVFVTHTETSTGTTNPIPTIGEILKTKDVLYLVDAVSSLAGEEFRQDAWGIDVAASASQKGLMCPPGLAFISVGPRALERMKTAKLPRFYFDLSFYRESKKVPETPFTPPVSLLAGLALALESVKRETLETYWARYKKLAQHTRSAVKETLGCSLLSARPANVLTAFYGPSESEAKKIPTTTVLKKLRDDYKITIADGQGHLKGKILRIAHMGAITKEDIDRGIAALVEAYASYGVSCRSLSFKI
ncbi:MAG: alanine--glyoxylate aminotransferase family protein [Elusimicrobia bacterium]|nr:alanine--glyoxylate aminotransferase family protein [Elusimicrobiota bacterium]